MIGPGRRGAEAAAIFELSEETVADVLPMSVIFEAAMVASGREGSLNGGFWRPCFAMRNFWFEGGMDRSDDTRSDRSLSVESDAKESATGLPWCVRVTDMSSPDADAAVVGSEAITARSWFARLYSPILSRK